MAKKTHTLIGGGEAFIGPADGSAPLRFLGEVSKVEISFDEEKKTLRNYSTPGGGNADVVSLVSDVKLALTTHGFDVENLAMATFGEAGAITGGTVTDEEHVAYKGGYLRAEAGIQLSSVVVSKGATPLVEGSDYEIKGGGIRILPATTAISDGDTLKLSYTHAASRTVEAILNSGREYRFVFDGFNQADDNRPVVLDVWKAKASPASLGLVGDDFGNIEFSFDLIKDDTRTGSGVSRFFRLTQLEG